MHPGLHEHLHILTPTNISFLPNTGSISSRILVEMGFIYRSPMILILYVFQYCLPLTVYDVLQDLGENPRLLGAVETALLDPAIKFRRSSHRQE